MATPLDLLTTIRTQLADLGTSLTTLDTALRAPPVRAVTDAASLTAALTVGGAIQLAPGRYVGNFTVTAPTTLTGSNAALGRVAPGDVSAWSLVAEDRLRPVLTIPASQVLVRGLTLTGVAPDRTVVQVGSNLATTVAAQPVGVTLDQVAVLADTAGGHRGVEMHGADMTVTRSHVAGFVEQGRDSQAIWANNGPGPYRIEDNYLEGSGENILIGGDTVRIQGLVPSDILIRGNTFFKPQAWRQRAGSVKNVIEVKNGQRIRIEGNRLDGCWRDAQPGAAIVLTPRNQYGDSPWTIVQDVVIIGNRIVNHTDGAAVSVLGMDDNHPSQRTAQITIEGNYFASQKGVLVNRGIAGLTIARNTIPLVRWQLLQFTGIDAVKTTLTVTGNACASGEYGIVGDGVGAGPAALDAYAPGYAWSGNVVEKTAVRSVPWPVGTTLLQPGTMAGLLDLDGHYVPGGAGW